MFNNQNFEKKVIYSRTHNATFVDGVIEMLRQLESVLELQMNALSRPASDPPRHGPSPLEVTTRPDESAKPFGKAVYQKPVDWARSTGNAPRATRHCYSRTPLSTTPPEARLPVSRAR